MNRMLIACVVLAGLTFAGPALAGPFADFEGGLRDAYGTYRTALFQSNTGNTDATAKALQSLSEKWAALSVTWGKTPPPQYADDAAYPDTLASVSAVIADAQRELAAGDLTKVHVALEELRGQVGALHERNGIITFSDRMNAYHAKMEEVLSLDLAALPEGGLSALTDDAAVLAYLVENIAAHPAPEAADPAYTGLVAGMRQSVQALQTATHSHDAAAAKAAVGGLKGAYAKFFAKFG